MAWLTLLVRPVSECDGGCAACPWRSVNGRNIDVLPAPVLEEVLSLVKGLRFDEAVFLCPNPLTHPKLPYLASMVREVARRVYCFIPVSSASLLRKDVLEALDEAVLVTSSLRDFRISEQCVKYLLSQGFDNLSVYVAVGGRVNEALPIISRCRDYGLRVRVGSLPYTTYPPLVDPRTSLEGMGFEVGLSYGYLYGYRASVAFVNNYPVVLLTEPEAGCRKLYIDPYGRVAKCPLHKDFIDANAGVTLDELRRVIYSECAVRGERGELAPKVEISLVTPDGKVIPPDILNLLEVLSHVKSFRAACSLLGYVPSTYIGRVRSLERELGVKLITTRKGGYRRGMTLLTAEGEGIVERYREVRETVAEALSRRDIRKFVLG